MNSHIIFKSIDVSDNRPHHIHFQNCTAINLSNLHFYNTLSKSYRFKDDSAAHSSSLHASLTWFKIRQINTNNSKHNLTPSSGTILSHIHKSNASHRAIHYIGTLHYKHTYNKYKHYVPLIPPRRVTRGANCWFPTVYMSCMSQNFSLLHVSNTSVLNFRIFCSCIRVHCIHV